MALLAGNFLSGFNGARMSLLSVLKGRSRSMWDGAVSSKGFPHLSRGVVSALFCKSRRQRQYAGLPVNQSIFKWRETHFTINAVHIQTLSMNRRTYKFRKFIGLPLNVVLLGLSPSTVTG